MLLGVWHAPSGGALLGNLACLAAAACYALGFPYTRRFLSTRPESAVSLSAGQLLCGSAELALVAPLLTRAPASLPVQVVASVLALGALGTGLAYILNYGVIRAAGATIASTVIYVISHLFSTAAGVLLLGERIIWNEPVGGLVVILGVAVSQRRLNVLRLRRLRVL